MSKEDIVRWIFNKYPSDTTDAHVNRSKTAPLRNTGLSQVGLPNGNGEQHVIHARFFVCLTDGDHLGALTPN